jgi:hypothetical protein
MMVSALAVVLSDILYNLLLSSLLSLKPKVKGNFAARLGFEPRYTASEAVVLPLDDLAILLK